MDSIRLLAPACVVVCLVLGVAASATGCAPPENAPLQLDASPTLTGVDADSDGVRDDIGTLIARQELASDERAAVTAYARGLQSMLATDLSGLAPDDATAAAEAYARAVTDVEACASDPAREAIGRVEALTLNTPERRRHLDEIEGLLAGRSIGVSSCN